MTRFKLEKLNNGAALYFPFAQIRVIGPRFTVQ
jgi:hypothetical protein